VCPFKRRKELASQRTDSETAAWRLNKKSGRRARGTGLRIDPLLLFCSVDLQG